MVLYFQTASSSFMTAAGHFLERRESIQPPHSSSMMSKELSHMVFGETTGALSDQPRRHPPCPGAA
jgi:hypothetical protein